MGRKTRAADATPAKPSSTPAAMTPGRMPVPASESEGLLQPDTDSGLNVDECIEMLARLFKINFKLYNRVHMMRRVQQVMMKLGVGHLQALETKLQLEREARTEVLSDVISSDTSFFRDQREFDFFKSSIAPQILRRAMASRRPVRIWVCGCSTGEEVYSIAIALCELIDASDDMRNAQVRLFATDMNEDLLRQARLGEYQIHPHEVDTMRLQRFFTSSSNKYRAAQRLRSMVMFGKHDVLRQMPYMNIDLMACRHMMSLLTAEGRLQLLSSAHEALQSNIQDSSDAGFLWLGQSEDLHGDANEAFRRVDPSASFFHALAIDESGEAPRLRAQYLSNQLSATAIEREMFGVVASSTPAAATPLARWRYSVDTTTRQW
jgi:two-component system CheB/CheR fusion protein